MNNICAYLPLGICSIIEKYIHDLELCELYSEFARYYHAMLNLSPNEGNVPQIKIHQTLNRNDIQYELGDEISVGGYNKHPHVKDPTCVLTTGGIGLKLPYDLWVFYSLFKPQSFEYNWVIPWTFICPTNFKVCLEMYYPKMDNNNPHYGKVIHAHDWVNILYDHNSVDQNWVCGSLYTNLNTQSEEYGRIYAYSSSDSGDSICVIKSFEETIKKIMILRAKSSICDKLNWPFSDT